MCKWSRNFVLVTRITWRLYRHIHMRRKKPAIKGVLYNTTRFLEKHPNAYITRNRCLRTSLSRRWFHFCEHTSPFQELFSVFSILLTNLKLCWNKSQDLVGQCMSTQHGNLDSNPFEKKKYYRCLFGKNEAPKIFSYVFSALFHLDFQKK